MRATSLPFAAHLSDALTAAREPLLFALRLWVSVCLALFIAFWLQLDNPSWAGASAAIVCQPQLGASLRKGWFRMIGTVVGATMIVVLTACFPQNRIAFLGFLAVWGGICAFVATGLRNFASYSAALAGFTAAIIAADTLGATGGASPDVFMLAVSRASEICIGIVCAGIVLAGTDFGGAQRRLAGSFANLAAEITSRFVGVLKLASLQLVDTQAKRRELVRRVIALNPLVDQALGESSYVRYRSSTLQRAVHGLVRALDGWRAVATHLHRSPGDGNRQQVNSILPSIPAELRSAGEAGSPGRWIGDPMALRRACEESVRKLLAMPAGTPSLRLLADETAKVLAGMLNVLDGLALLTDAPDAPPPAHCGFRPSVPDWLPAFVNAGRAFVTIGAAEIFWVVTAWPNGASAVMFAMIVVLLLSPRGDLAYGGALAFAIGTAACVIFAAFIEFAVLPGDQTFAAFCVGIALFLIPAGFILAQSRKPAVIAAVTAMTYNFVPLLAPTNQMNYDTAQFYNAALAIVVGCAIAPLAFLLLPPLSPALRTRRLLVLALRDLRRLANNPQPPTLEKWESRIYGRLSAMPDQATPLQRARLLAALSAGADVIYLRRAAAHLDAAADLDAALTAVAQGNSEIAIARLREFDGRLASDPETADTLRTRSRIVELCETLSAHASYFDAGETA